MPVPSSSEPPVCYRHPAKETWISCQRCGRPICPDCMRDASVGFQCPDCVKEGARSTRQAKATYGGLRVTSGATVTMTLVGLNVVTWLLIVATGGQASKVLDALALLPRTATNQHSDGTLYQITGFAQGAFWQPLTSMFVHVELLHIGFNMLALYFLGPQLEQVLGRARFLAVYLVSGLVGSAVVLWFSAPNGQTLGASGAVFGLMGALVVVAIKVGADFRQILFWIGLNLVFTFVGAGISWEGHIGGLFGGVLLAAIIVYAPKARREPIQWTGIALVLALAVVSMVVRAASLG